MATSPSPSPTPPTVTETVTHGIRVGTVAFFLPEESDPDRKRYVWGYRILISNDSATPVTLVSRRWEIVDANGKRESVEGPGVVGQTPTIPPGQSFKYVSSCALRTAWGTMEGSYAFRTEPDGLPLKAAVGRFYLTPSQAQ